MTVPCTAVDWQAISAVGTIAAAGIVAWYTWETACLRKIAQDQLEASIKPFVTVSARSHVRSTRTIELDRTEDQPDYSFTIYNDGNGPALNLRLKHTIKSMPSPKVGGQVTCEGLESLVPLGPHSQMDVRLNRNKVFGFTVSQPMKDHEVYFDLEYESTSHRKYRTLLRANADSMDVYDVQYDELGRG